MSGGLATGTVEGRRTRHAALFCVVLVGTANLGAAELQRFDYARPRMGTLVRISVYSAGEALANDAADAAYARAKALNAILSDYEPESEVNRLCRDSGPGKPVTVSEPLFEVLERSLEIAKLSGGAFDPTIGPVVKLWRKSGRSGQLPASDDLRAARNLVDWTSVVLDSDERTVELKRPGTRLDFGGIAKGYVAEAMKAEFAKRNLPRVMIDAGGDLVLGDPPPGRTGWRIALEGLDAADPNAGREAATIEVANAAVATSGDLYKFVEIDGVRYSHIVDPRTGLGLTDRSSVTVLAPDGTTADAFASAISVLGPDRGLALASRAKGVEALVHFARGDEVRSARTCGFPVVTSRPAAPVPAEKPRQ